MSVSIDRANPLHQQYLAQSPEYMYHGSPDHFDRDEAHRYIGWKIHLNVAPENVLVVSTFLKDHGYTHKFISNADIEAGKIFTIYFGSKALTERDIPEIYNNLGHLLEEPRAPGEILVAPRIVARFETYHHPVYIAGSCLHGIPLMRYYDEENLEASYVAARDRLQQDYGDYFGGGIKYYDPSQSPQ